MHEKPFVIYHSSCLNSSFSSSSCSFVLQGWNEEEEDKDSLDYREEEEGRERETPCKGRRRSNLDPSRREEEEEEEEQEGAGKIGTEGGNNGVDQGIFPAREK